MAITGFSLTDDDVADQTRATNERLAAAMEGRPALEEIDDPAASRAARERGEGPFAQAAPIPEGIDRTVPGRAGAIPVRIFRPAEPRGVLLHLHGGGWTLGSAGAQDPLLWGMSHAADVAVVSVGYRLAPEHPHPAAADDCEDAANWLMAEAAAEFGTGRLAIAGESAGAHLAALTLVRLAGRARAFRAAQLTFGAYDLSMTPSQLAGHDKMFIPTRTMRWFYDQYLPGLGTAERRDPTVSPLYADLRGMPPARFTVGTEDPLLDDSLFMAARWQAAGNTAELDVVADAAHGFIAFGGVAAERELTRQVAFIAGAVAAG
ncbi:alpha/beta hydrolase fold domain-containing protein [Spirillospora sp. NBC_01491]|uniref:alpha/beta hydrolase fold domain-containing protein n=1 Tax=Spirillospora sp. NBC_01491 TaxID=2976007 RepID=UPI002E364048|nr:alpha/beta hydrolase fold domain-containing protein [Spirillospora sp. NBC_01491]